MTQAEVAKAIGINRRLVMNAEKGKDQHPTYEPIAADVAVYIEVGEVQYDSS